MKIIERLTSLKSAPESPDTPDILSHPHVKRAFREVNNLLKGTDLFKKLGLDSTLEDAMRGLLALEWLRHTGHKSNSILFTDSMKLAIGHSKFYRKIHDKASAKIANDLKIETELLLHLNATYGANTCFHTLKRLSASLIEGEILTRRNYDVKRMDALISSYIMNLNALRYAEVVRQRTHPSDQV